MIAEFCFLILTTLISYYLYKYKKNHNYFDRHGINYFPGVPVFGNVLNSTFLTKHIIEVLDDTYNAFPDDRYVGFVEGTKPLILVRDPEIIKSIMVKKFDHFTDRQTLFPEEIAPLLATSLVMMRGESWYKMRTTLSPSFTGSKLRQMMPFITEVSSNILDYLKGHQFEDTDVKDLMQRYTNDVIASTALGIQVNSLQDRDNKLYKSGKETVRHTIKKGMCFYLATQSLTAAKIMKFLNIGILPAEAIKLFREIVATTIEYRKKHNVTRPDFIHFLKEASKENYPNGDNEFDLNHNDGTMKPNKNKEWTPDEIAGQAYIAFLAGFENSSSLLTFCIHELAINTNVQEKLYQEIRTNEEIKEQLNYDDLMQLKYMDCVFNETFRKWSPGTMMLDRVCTKPFVLPPPNGNGKPYRVNPGDVIYGAVNAIQMDPNYHPDPEVFNPDRFSDENKHKIKPFTYMPFGVGPRACLGKRLVALQIKLMLYYLVLNFKIVPCAKTAVPIRLNANLLKIRAVSGTWVQFQARNK